MDSIPDQSAQPLLPAKVSPGIFTALVKRWFARFCRRGGLFIGLLALILFYHAAGFGFLNWGDAELATDLPPVSLGIFDKGITAAFQAVAPWDGNFGPLSPISHALDFQLFGRKPLPAHLTNVWLHVFNVILLFAVVRRFRKSVWAAALAAAIFALHPLQVAPVVWISQRRSLLATFFVLAAVWWWMRYRRTSRISYYGGAFASCLFAALSYPASAVVLVLLFSVIGSPSPRPSPPGEGEAGLGVWSLLRRGYNYRLLGVLAIWMIVAGVMVWSLVKTTPWNAGAAENLRFQLREAAAVHLVDVFSMLARSLWKMVTLGSVSPTFNLETGNVSAGDLWWAMAGVVVVIGLWFIVSGFGFRSQSAGRRLGATGTGRGPRTAENSRFQLQGHGPLILVGLVWFLVCGMAAVFTAREDAFAPVQWTYLGNAGLALAAAGAVVAGLQAIGQRKLLRIAVVMAVLILGWRSGGEMDKWSDNGQLLDSLASSQPAGWQGWRIQHALGWSQQKQGDHSEAERYFREALANEYDPRTLLFLGYVEGSRKNFRRATEFFEEVVRQKHLIPPAETALGEMARDRGDLTEAARHFSKALGADPRYPTALAELAMIYAAAPDAGLRNGREALVLARRAIEWTKNMDLRGLSAAAAAHAELGEFRRAQALASSALLRVRRSGRADETLLCQKRLENYKDNKPWRMPIAETTPVLLSAPK